MMTNKLSALINLLDDPDHEVYNAVLLQLLSNGEEILPYLEEAWEQSSNEIMQRRIERIIQQIQLEQAYKGVKQWIDSGANDILEGAFRITKHQYPDLIYHNINQTIEKIKTNIWLEINDSLTALEKIRIVNHFIYDIYHFDHEPDFMQASYCFINHVVEARKGNPVSLSIIYLAICQRLNLPVYGVCVPRNFLTVYKDSFNPDPLFYINPFFKGTPLSRADIELYFKQMKIHSQEKYFTPCSNKAVVLRLVETLIYIYEQDGNMEKATIYKKLIPLFGDEQTYFQD